MNAIILAAGMGSRLFELTKDIPKPLIEVNGKPIIETQIQYLQEIGIQDIFIVVGYYASSFDYLVSKYQVQLIYNSQFSIFNNFYSLYLARHKLGNTYILDGDVVFKRNFLNKHLKNATYFSIRKKLIIGEWVLAFTKGKLIDIMIIDNKKESILFYQNDQYVISGVSYWPRNIVPIILDYFESALKSDGKFTDQKYQNFFWDQIIYENRYKLSIDVITLDSNELFEIDNMSDYLLANIGVL